MPTRVPWRVKRPAEWRPGATTAAPVRGHGSGCSCWGCWTTFPSCRRAPVRPVVAGSKHPRCTCGYRRTVRSAIVRHEDLGHGRDQLAAGRVEEADGSPRLTVEATWGPDVGSVRMEFHLRPCIDAKRSNRAGKSLANGGRRRSAMQQARCWTRPGLLVLGWSPPPESNRRPHPYHGTTRNRCADHRFPRSRPTVGAEVIGSLSAKLCVLKLTPVASGACWIITAASEQKHAVRHEGCCGFPFVRSAGGVGPWSSCRASGGGRRPGTKPSTGSSGVRAPVCPLLKVGRGGGVGDPGAVRVRGVNVLLPGSGACPGEHREYDLPGVR